MNPVPHFALFPQIIDADTPFVFSTSPAKDALRNMSTDSSNELLLHGPDSSFLKVYREIDDIVPV